MADIWDETFNWEPPTPAATIQENQQAASPAAASTATGVKSQTGMPDWWTDWARSAFTGGNAFSQGNEKVNNAFNSYFSGAPKYAENVNTGVNQMNDVFSRYFSGGPQFGNQIGTGVNRMEDVFSKYFSGGPRYQEQTDQMVGNLPGAWSQYQQLPGQIENKRKAMIDQIYANLPRMQELYQPKMEEMSRRNILNSDVTGKALADIQSNVNRDIGGQTAAANTWAADEGLGYTKNMSTVLNNIINGMLGASSAYTGQGTSALGGAGNVLGNAMNASNLYTGYGNTALGGAGNVLGNAINASNMYSGYGKDAASVGLSQQGQLNDLIKMLQGSTTFNV